jgi:hypothetical protein
LRDAIGDESIAAHVPVLGIVLDDRGIVCIIERSRARLFGNGEFRLRPPSPAI